jgi:hypothetical protein
MKTLLKTLSVIFVLGLLFTGCKKDDEKPEANYFTMNADTSYALSWGAMYYFGTGDWSDYGYNIFLCSEGMSADETDTWSGSGDYIKLEIASSSTTGIPSGTYTFQLFSVLAANHFDQFSQWVTGWNASILDAAYLASGTLVVVNKGDVNYEFTLNGTDVDGNTVKLHYNGSIDYYFDESGKKATNAGSLLSPGKFFGPAR